tara:strand:+ start:186 stop:332 length:147 start_codon:yes stop_codon:yes gene_type:complete
MARILKITPKEGSMKMTNILAILSPIKGVAREIKKLIWLHRIFQLLNI